jgi:hypothetical protein
LDEKDAKSGAIGHRIIIIIIRKKRESIINPILKLLTQVIGINDFST